MLPKTRRLRVILLGALVLPMAVVLAAGSLQAQIFRPAPPPKPFTPPVIPKPFSPPTMPKTILPPHITNPPFIPPTNIHNKTTPNFPTIERVWQCTGCRGELGRGAFPPNQCPHCGARIVNGIGGPNSPIKPGGNPPPFNPGGNPPAFNPPVFPPNPPINPPVVNAQENPPIEPPFNPPPADIQVPPFNPAPVGFPVGQNALNPPPQDDGVNGYLILGVVVGGLMIVGLVIGAIKAARL
ncbi:MAG: hypothetical protein L0Y72_13700 [Gemmataceae bacterium]|nr:hypothetical protein [Gemmataceae bacterium]MCI0740095.1 hypothetical protein [Gemmataceae bacterium]